jgi:hypothetical protein
LGCLHCTCAGALLLALRTGRPTGPDTSALDSREQTFLQRALQPNVSLRPSAAQLLANDTYIREGPENALQPELVLQPDVTLRPSAARRLAKDPCIREGPECAVAAAAAAERLLVLRERQISRSWTCMQELLQE